MCVITKHSPVTFPGQRLRKLAANIAKLCDTLFLGEKKNVKILKLVRKSIKMVRNFTMRMPESVTFAVVKNINTACKNKIVYGKNLEMVWQEG